MLRPRPPLQGDRDADVAIIGGGLTGLWTAYYLLERDPSLRIVVLEKEFAGFGASGRNGGWCSALFPASVAALERRHGRDAALAMRRAMIATVDEVGRVTAAEGIDCDFAKGGTVAWARSEVQLRAARAEVDEAAGYGVDRIELWDRDRVHGVTGALGASFDPACARLHPAKLVAGLAEVLERRGAVIHEHTEVTGWSKGRVETARGTVRAPKVVLATEAYTATFRPTHRRLMPLYSLMVATEPLPDGVLGRRRHPARPHVHRLPPPAHLRPAHRRRPVRVRRPRRALPLGQRHPGRLRPRAEGVRASAHDAA